MNSTLFATIVTALNACDDTQGAQVLAVINGIVGMGVASPAVAPVEAPTPKVYEPAEDVRIPIALVKGAGKGKKAFKLGYGAGRAGAKLMIKAAGFAWDDELKAYVGTLAQYNALEVADNALSVSAEWVQAGRDKAAAKAAKKANKGA